ncbi:MAG: MFS transporter [Chloroflexota bacterium]|nr:MFS transporter [Chloroflexota bacterium]
MMEGAPAPSHAAAGGPRSAPVELDRRTRFEILGAVMLALFLGVLDQTVVGTALPRIVTDLGGNDLYTWVVTIYLLTSTITVPFYGKLSDLYGRKPLLIIGIGLFLAGSALSGLSQTMWQLILFRGVQGLGAGSLFPITLAVIGDLFTPAERGKYQGLFGGVFGVAFLVGPWIGGFLTDSISWHWVFYVNVPFGIASLYIIWRLLPNIRRPDVSHNLDYLGALVFTVGVALLLVGLTNKQTAEWTDPSVGALIGLSLAILAVFVLIEARAKEPIVPLDLWRIRTYASSLLATFFVSFGFFGAVIFLPRWFQVVRGESATASGYLMFPLLFGMIGSSIVSGQIVARTGRYKALILGALVFMAAGLALMTQLRAETPFPVLWAWMFVTGVGIGPTLAVFTIVVQNAVPFEKLGTATSNLTFFRQIGGSVGLAIAGTVFATSLRDTLPGQLMPVFQQVRARVPAQFQAQLDSVGSGLQNAGGNLNLNNLTGVGQSFGRAVVDFATVHAPGQAATFVKQLLEPFIPQLDAAFHQAFSLAVGTTFVVGVASTVVALVAAAALREEPLRRAIAAPAGPADGVAAEARGPAAG